MLISVFVVFTTPTCKIPNDNSSRAFGTFVGPAVFNRFGVVFDRFGAVFD